MISLKTFLSQLFQPRHNDRVASDLPEDADARTLAVANDAWARFQSDPTIKSVITVINDDGTKTVKEVRE